MIRALIIMIAGSLALACVVTPLVYSALESAMDEVPWPYSRVFNRVAMLCLLGFIIGLRKQFPIEGVKQAFKRHRSPSRWVDLGAGFVISGATALAAVPLLVRTPYLDWSSMPSSTLLSKLALAVPAAILVSFLEESFFRVMILEGLRRRMALVAAVVVSSAFYAWVHFITPVKSWVYPGWSPTIGFEYLSTIMGRFALPGMWPGLFGLFCIGVVLCALMIQHRNVYLCVGLHAGWFLIAKLAVYVTTLAPGAVLPDGTNKRYFLVGLPWTWIAILAAGSLAWLWSRRFPRN